MSSEEDNELNSKHIVSDGESIEDIAFMYETSSSKIFSLNDLLPDSTISSGEEIVVSEFPNYFLRESLAATAYCPEGLDDCGVCGGDFFFDYSLGGPCGCNGEVYIECEGELVCSDSTCPVYGCTDPSFSNYNPNATEDDGTCCLDGESFYEFGNWRKSYCGCTDINACNYNPRANRDDGSCEYATCSTPTRTSVFVQVLGCTDYKCPNYNPRANVDDGSCNCSGCTDLNACNYDPDAQTDDGSCEYSSCVETPTSTPTNIAGCIDPNACNRNIDANVDDGSCLYLDDCGECGGNNSCITPTSTPYPILGCTDSNSCNHNPNAEINDGSCLYLDDCGECGGNNSCYGCMDDTACNYDPSALIHDNSCEYIVCEETPTVTSTTVEYGCTDFSACNYDELANTDDNSCDYSCYGCTDSTACNYDLMAIFDDYSCEYDSCISPTPTISPTVTPTAYINGCTDVTACNYDSTAESDNGSCEYTSCLGCTEPEACNYNSFSTIDDGSCEYISCAGCMDIFSCNHSAEATIDDGSCIYECYGCNDPLANNYDNGATRDCRNAPEGTGCEKCNYSTPTITLTPTFVDQIVDPHPNSDTGCTNFSACNYNPKATIDDGSCEFISCWGCLDVHALNYCSTCTKDNQLCYYPEAPTPTPNSTYGCMDRRACNYSSSYTEDCISALRRGAVEECEPCQYYCYGCTDPMACNYDSFATIDDGSCKSVQVSCSSYYYDKEIESSGGYNDFCDCECNRFDACGECGGSAVKNPGSYPEITGGLSNECGTCGAAAKDDCETCENHPSEPKYWFHDYEVNSLFSSSTPTQTTVFEERLFDNKSGTGDPVKCDCENLLTVDRCDRCGDPDDICYGSECSGCNDENAVNYEGDFLYNDKGDLSGCNSDPVNPCGTNHCRYNYVEISYDICEECSKQEKGKSKVFEEETRIILIKDNINKTLFERFSNLQSNFSMHSINGKPGRLLGASSVVLFECEAESNSDYNAYLPSISGESGDRSCNGLLGCTYEYEDCSTGGVSYIVHNDDWVIDPPNKIEPYKL